MRILYHIPYPDGLGADRWICRGWEAGFVACGHQFFLLRAGERLADKANAVKPDVFFTAVNILDLERERETLRIVRQRGTRVLLWVHWPLEPRIDPRRAEILRAEDVADIYFGEREPEQMAAFERETGKTYHVIPNAADPKAHFPVAPVGRFQYDIVYLGANLAKKRWFAEQVLAPLRKAYRVAVFGPGWGMRDNILRASSKACKAAGAFPLARAIDRHRLTIPPEEERLLYSSAKICLNFHEREPDGTQPHYIVNQRTFKIPACGGFEICDDVPAIRRYFGADELVMVPLDEAEWMRTIAYYLDREDERRQTQMRGTARALRDHMSTNRVEQVRRLLSTL